ncbi:GDSL family lipase [Nocardiopsis exhalans]|uniref:GDSL family lipase n=1 Tax=Nocardiopsis exhalans TaxID=163604 RepID=A0ABY5D7Z0_9ACTN|nr:GDSL family lipase [Nocardiopsis exhalans]USY19040.1 GDSL family lipase [Nocardiopsis exhalans]
MVQDPGEDATPEDRAVPEGVEERPPKDPRAAKAPEGRADEGTAEAAKPERSQGQDPDQDQDSEQASWRSRWSERAPYWLTAAPWRRLAWRAPGLQRPGSRFEPGPLGLLGVMLAAMAVTLLLLQTGSGGVGGDQGELADEPVSVPGPPDGELRIMMVGDSATQGSSGDHTWRYHLWSHLSEQDVEFAFVGPRDDLHSLADEEGSGDHSYAVPDFDTAHAARWGATARDLSADIAQIAAEHEPQYLLLLAGTEDILSGGSADHALDGIAETVSTVRVVLGDARFVVGELPDVEGSADDTRVNGEIERFNMGLVDLAEQLTSGTSPVVVAQVAKEYAPVHDNWDATNPNVRGELKIAAAFADALAAPLGVGEEYPRPLPSLSAGPLTAPEPEYEETDDGLLLSWENVPGATDYRVVQRRVAPAPDDAAVIPADIESDEEQRFLTIESLFSGARYEFVVRPYKGRDEGAESEPLQLVWDDEPPPAPDWVRTHGGGSVVTWQDVPEAGHYEVWVRVLECGPDDRRPPADGRRAPADNRGLTGGDNTGNPTTDDQETPGGGGDPGGEGPRPTPSSPPEAPRPEPDPTPEPSVPAVPPPSPGTTCQPRDDRGPEDGEGWRTLGSVGEDPRWAATVSGPYEVVIRSYRDYVEGGYSDSVLLEG